MNVKSLILVVLVIPQMTFANDATAALYREYIPHLKLEKSTLKESLSTLEKIWIEKHPEVPFPVTIVDFERTEEYHTSAEAEITFELKNVSYNVALTYIAELSGYQLSNKRDQKVLRQLAWIEEDWNDAAFLMTPKIMEGLALDGHSSAENVQAALTKLGVKFDRGMLAVLAPEASMMIVRNEKSQLTKIEGILLLLEEGYSIQRPVHKESSK